MTPARVLRALRLAAAIVALLLGAAPHVLATSLDERRTAAALDAVRDDPAGLRAFLAAMPKGGDLHNHLAGAVATEKLIEQAAEAGLCIDAAYAAVAPPVGGAPGVLGTLVGEPAVSCAAGQRPAGDAFRDGAFFNALVRAWSMEGFAPAVERGHDHFFATFAKFGAAAARRGDMLAAVARDNAAQNVLYLETMVSRGGDGVRALAAQVGSGELEAIRRELLAGGMAQVVATARAETDADEARMDELLGCGGPRPEPACALELRYLVGVSRLADPLLVFANLVLGLELQRSDRRYVGVNLAAPEDHPIALRDYRLHMQIVRWLRAVYPRGHVSLHAGELVAGMVAPDELRYHVREAVEVAGAERIGHGVDLVQEDGHAGVLGVMARRQVLVEVPLTSNEQILGVAGAAHPLARYLAAGVPVALTTDDPGISRIDLTHEYALAVTRHGLDYHALKALARASLEHAFIAGDSLWRAPADERRATACARDVPGAGRPGPRCRALLRASPKAALQWRHEAALRAFERAQAGSP